MQGRAGLTVKHGLGTFASKRFPNNSYTHSMTSNTQKLHTLKTVDTARKLNLVEQERLKYNAIKEEIPVLEVGYH